VGEGDGATLKTLEAWQQILFVLNKEHLGRVVDFPHPGGVTMAAVVTPSWGAA
jgi:hypothetical protein